MPRRGTTIRHIRVDDEFWERAGQAAQLDGTNRSDLIRKLLAEYADKRLAATDSAETVQT